jgi:hypothetical protein
MTDTKSLSERARKVLILRTASGAIINEMVDAIDAKDAEIARLRAVIKNIVMQIEAGYDDEAYKTALAGRRTFT